MNSKRFVICDIEATGLGDDRDIIEIALITLDDDKVVDVYQTLVNPLQPVSEFIQNFTSISIRELEQAPKFYDVADAIRMRLEDSIFVSHNTDFDYGILMKKYLQMGQELKLKTFCTLKVAQEEIPGLRSYNLDALCSFFHIKNSDRHRAIGDAKATLELFHELRDLKLKVYPKIYFHPHHEKEMKKLSTKAGLIHFKDFEGKVIRFEASFNMEKTARELLEIKPANRLLLEKTETLVGEPTGSALIAEFRKLLFYPYRAPWIITVETSSLGEKFFQLKPFKKNLSGAWHFSEYQDAKKKLQQLVASVRDDSFAYREGQKSKEEILRHNQKVEKIQKDTLFPSPHILLFGEGRVMGEKSLILIRAGHVVGYGYAEAREEDITHNPESYLTRRFSKNLGADLLAQRYLRVLKNMKNKTESWRPLAGPSISPGLAPSSF